MSSKLRKIVLIFAIIVCSFSIFLYNKKKFKSVYEIDRNSDSYVQCNSFMSKMTKTQNNYRWITVESRRVSTISAYYDDKDLFLNETAIRILGLKFVNETNEFLCLIFLSDDNFKWNLSVTSAIFIKIDEAECLDDRPCPGVLYDPVFIFCPINSISQQKFSYVGIIPVQQYYYSCDSFTHLPRITISPQKTDEDDKKLLLNFSVCVSPVFNWTNEILLKLFLEHYLSQGVTNFVIYKISWSDDVQGMLSKTYSNFIEIIHWPVLNCNSTNSTNCRNQIIAMNDCLWSLRRRSKFVISVDLDEFVIAANPKLTLYGVIMEQDNEEIGGFIVQNRFISFDLDNINAKTSIKVDKMLYDVFDRSKTIVKPDTVEKLSVHTVWRYIDGYRSKCLSPELVYMLHWKPMRHELISSNFTQRRFIAIFPKLLKLFDP